MKKANTTTAVILGVSIGFICIFSWLSSHCISINERKKAIEVTLIKRGFKSNENGSVINLNTIIEEDKKKLQKQISELIKQRETGVSQIKALREQIKIRKIETEKKKKAFAEEMQKNTLDLIDKTRAEERAGIDKVVKENEELTLKVGDMSELIAKWKDAINKVEVQK